MGQNARQASEVELYRDFAPYSFFSNSAMRTARSELSADWSIMARGIVPTAIRWKKSMDGPFTLENHENKSLELCSGLGRLCRPDQKSVLVGNE